MNRSFIRKENLTYGNRFPSIADASKLFAFTSPLSFENSRPILFFQPLSGGTNCTVR
jgi:hypothetical protein